MIVHEFLLYSCYLSIYFDSQAKYSTCVSPDGSVTHHNSRLMNVPRRHALHEWIHHGTKDNKRAAAIYLQPVPELLTIYPMGVVRYRYVFIGQC